MTILADRTARNMIGWQDRPIVCLSVCLSVTLRNAHCGYKRYILQQKCLNKYK